MIIQHADGRFSVYGHLSNVKSGLAAGQTIKAMDFLGYSGNSGESSAAHLHYAERSGGVEGAQLDPGFMDVCWQGSKATYPAAFGPGITSWTQADSNGKTVLSDGYGCHNPTPPNHDPVATFDAVSSPAPGYVRVRGWAFDPDDYSHSVSIHAYVGGVSGVGEGHNLGGADRRRDDVGAAYPGVGNFHGFDETFSTAKTGSQSVCVYAINVGAGTNKLIGCKSTTIAPKTAPGGPRGVAAAEGRLRAEVSWLAPSSDGGSPVTGYTVTSSPGAKTCSTTGELSCRVSGLTAGTSYTFTVKATNSVGQGPASTASNAVVPWDGSRFHPLVPARVLDSRPGGTNIGPFSTPWSPGTAGIRDVPIGGLAGVPADADAVVLNVTVVNSTAGSFLQLWPTGSAQPQFGSSLNFNPGQIVPNAATVKLGTGGKVRVFNAAGNVDVIIDVAGYYSAADDGAGFTPLTPDRVLDSRPGGTNFGPFSTPWSPGTAGIRDVPIGGLAGVPADADAVVLNVTVVNPTAGSFLQLWPTGSAQPQFGSSLNFNPGQIVPNAVTVKLGSGGKVRVFNAAGNVDVIIDVAGYYETGVGRSFHPIAPGRALDSRPGATNIGAFNTPWSGGTAGIRDVQIGGVVGVPADAAGVVSNVTVVNPTAGSFLQLWPTGTTQPTFGSSLNFNPGQIVPNAVTVKLGSAGKVRVFNAVGNVNVIIDIAGYFR